MFKLNFNISLSSFLQTLFCQLIDIIRNSTYGQRNIWKRSTTYLQRPAASTNTYKREPKPWLLRKNICCFQ